MIYHMTATNFGHGQGYDRRFRCDEGSIDVSDGSNIMLETVNIAQFEQHIYFTTNILELSPSLRATSMYVTDVGDGICWRQFCDVGDGLAVLVTNILYLLT